MENVIESLPGLLSLTTVSFKGQKFARIPYSKDCLYLDICYHHRMRLDILQAASGRVSHSCTPGCLRTDTLTLIATHPSLPTIFETTGAITMSQNEPVSYIEKTRKVCLAS